jgi:cysteinyl-tRNA synthetase
MFNGSHPILTQAYSPMTIRFFILQTHYRSTLDFSNEALQAAEKGLKRLWEAYELLKKFETPSSSTGTSVSTIGSPASAGNSASVPRNPGAPGSAASNGNTLSPSTGAPISPQGAPGTSAPADPELDAKVNGLLLGLDEFMNDDFNTAKVLANMFELVPVINSIKSGHIRQEALSPATLRSLQTYFTNYLEHILGLRGESGGDDHKLTGVMELLIEIRRDARTRKDYATSDKIRNQLLQLGIVLKDEKDGGVSFTFA